MQEQRYFVRDCNGYIIGNKMGYRAHWAAERAQNNALKNEIWLAFESRLNTDDNLVSSIDLYTYEEAEKAHNEAMDRLLRIILTRFAK